MDNIDESVELNSNYRSGEMKKSSFSHSYQREGFVIPTIRDIEESSYQPEISCKSKSLFDSVKIEHSRARWVNQGLKILFYITKFVRQMKNHSNQASFKYLNSEMVELIGDISSDSNELLKKLSKSQIFLQMVMQKINNLPTIEPDSMFKLFWDIFILTQIMINIFFIPMKLGFNFSIESTTLQVILETLPTWTFVIDIVLNFFTAFYDKGQIHRQKAQIFERYVKFYFWWDLFIVLPFLLALFEVEYIQYIQILRLSRVKYIVQNIIEIINPSETIQAITSLIQSVFFIMFVSHFCACLWSLIGEMQNSQGLPSWLSAREIENADWSTKYIHSLYFSTITTLTVGYGDIIPTTNIERIYVIMMALVICGVFGYTISSIGEILKQLTEKESKFKQKMLSLTNYLKFKKINKQLQLQVRKYFEYVFTMEQDSNEFGDSLMNQLTKDLKEKVAIDIYEGMLIQSRLINKTLSKKSVQKLCSFVQEQKCAPEVTIASQNTQAQKLYFLQKGEIQLICDTNLRETKLALITANKFIGEREFIIQSDYKYSIKTANFCQLAYINYADFIKVVREDAQEDEKFCMMRDSLQFNQDKRNYGQVCYVCQWTHQFTDCPIIFLKINKEKVRNLCLVPFSQSRKPTERREKFRSPGMRFLREDAIQCLIDNSLINSEDLNPAFLEQLGYKMEVQSLLSVEKLKSISSSEKISSQSSSVVPFCKQISITRRFSKPKIRTSLYAEPDARNLRSQNSFMSKVGNKISSRLSIPSYTQFPSTSPDKFNKGTHEFEMAKQTSTAFEQTNMISQLQEEMNQITNPTKINSRCDYDIDRQFIAKNYYPNQNFDDIIAKFKKRQYIIIKMPLFSLHQTNTTCRAKKCTDAPAGTATDAQCDSYLAGCKTNGASCKSNITCSTLLTASACQVDENNKPCLLVNSLCYSYAKCEDIAMTTHLACQLFSPLCTTNGDKCIALTTCALTINLISCVVGTDGTCGWLPTSETNTAKCQKFGACSDATAIDIPSCAAYGRNCITDGVKCIDKSICSTYLTQIACETNGTDGVCQFILSSSSCRLRECTDATDSNSSGGITTHSGCYAFSAKDKCTTNGTSCIAFQACSAYTVEVGCFEGTDGLCIYALPVGQTTLTCRLKICEDFILSTSESCSVALTGAGLGIGCVSDGTNCIAKNLCSSYTSKEACNGGGTDGGCAFTPGSLTTPNVGTCKVMSACIDANNDSFACSAHNQACNWQVSTSDTTTTTACTVHTCASKASGSTCIPVPNFNFKTYTVCGPSTSGCIEVAGNTLLSSTCQQNTLKTFTWDETKLQCTACFTNQNNPGNGNIDNPSTEGNIIKSIASLVILAISVI